MKPMVEQKLMLNNKVSQEGGRQWDELNGSTLPMCNQSKIKILVLEGVI